jgi:hypothetical protein
MPALITVPDDREDFDNFCNAPENIALIPAGRIAEIGSPIKYRDGNNALLTQAEYMARHNVDPEPLWQQIQKYLDENGQLPATAHVGLKKPKTPTVNLSGRKF